MEGKKNKQKNSLFSTFLFVRGHLFCRCCFVVFASFAALAVLRDVETLVELSRFVGQDVDRFRQQYS